MQVGPASLLFVETYGEDGGFEDEPVVHVVKACLSSFPCWFVGLVVPLSRLRRSMSPLNDVCGALLLSLTLYCARARVALLARGRNFVRAHTVRVSVVYQLALCVVQQVHENVPLQVACGGVVVRQAGRTWNGG